MAAYRNIVFACMVSIVALLAALHAPGQLSVDSGVALYEGLAGHAIGWGPPFFAAVLAWLGGGVVGASVFVGLNAVAIYGCFALLLTDGVAKPGLRTWRSACAGVLVLNPLFAFYAGIVWKDVMLATCAMVATTMLLVACRRTGRQRWLLVAAALVVVAPMPLLRQQGILLAAPLAFAAAWTATSTLDMARTRRAAAMAAILVLTATMNMALGRLSEATIRPLAASPLSVGLNTIRAYDIAGMLAYALPSDTSDWSGADVETRQRARHLYSPERIDTLWHDPRVRAYINGLGDAGLRQVWWAGIRYDPVAYASHRIAAMRALLGFESIEGCVPAYWGVAIPPEYLEPLGLRDEMDPRDRLLGRTSIALHGTPVFRHWWYAGLLLLASIAAVRRRGADAVVVRTGAAIAWIYLASFAPTTIACDFRYLYPVACVSTVLCAWLLLRPGDSRNQTLMSEGNTRNSGTSASDPA